MKANERILEPGDVVQLDPAAHLTPKAGFFGGCFMVVTEPKAFGAVGDVLMPNGRGQHPSAAPYRATWEEMHYVGKAKWVSE
jgi:hypothetical protein